MQQARRSSPLFFVARAVVGYGTWFFTVPAVILQLFGVCIALVTILGMTLSLFPQIATAFLAAIAPRFPEIHGSFHISLVQPFLVTYSLLCLIASLLGPIMREKLPVQWKWTTQKSLFALIGLAAITYGTTMIFSIALHKPVLPSVIFFALTAFATVIAVITNALGTKILPLFH